MKAVLSSHFPSRISKFLWLLSSFCHNSHFYWGAVKLALIYFSHEFTIYIYAGHLMSSFEKCLFIPFAYLKQLQSFVTCLASLYECWSPSLCQTSSWQLFPPLLRVVSLVDGSLWCVQTSWCNLIYQFLRSQPMSWSKFCFTGLLLKIHLAIHITFIHWSN